MRGGDHHQDGLFSYVSLESRIPQNHPQRPIRKMVNQALKGLDLPPLFDTFHDYYREHDTFDTRIS